MENPVQETYSDTLFRAVGVLFVTAAIAENALSFQLARLMTHPNPIRPHELMALQGMETKVKLEKIAVAAHLQKPEHGARVRAICDRIRQHFQRRNDIAHYMDAGGAPDCLNLIVFKLKRDGSMAGRKRYKADQILSYAAAMHARLRQLDECLNELGIKNAVEPYELAPQPPGHHRPRNG